MKSKNQGFTLIELLVVISIIGMLASVALVSLNSARAKARDTKRIADLDQIRKALELYYDANGYYPGVTVSSGSCSAGSPWDCNGYYYSADASWDTFQTHLAPYIAKLPKDPVNNASAPWTNGNLSYAYGNVGRTTNPPQYDLTTQLETSHPERCQLKNWKFYYSQTAWCVAFGGSYSNQIYEASPR